MHFIFQEEKTVGERDAGRTAAKKYVPSVNLPLDCKHFQPSESNGYPKVVASC